MGGLRQAQAARKGIQVAAGGDEAARKEAARKEAARKDAEANLRRWKARDEAEAEAGTSDPEPDPVEPTPTPEPVAVEGDLDELNKRADALESEVRDLSSQIRSGQSRTSVTTGASVAERKRAEQKSELSDDGKRAQLAETRKELVSVLTAIEALEGVAPQVESAPQTRPDVRPTFDEKREPVFPERDIQRADEKLREAESRVYTSEQMSDLPYEYFRSGPEKGETVIDVGPEGNQVPRRYAVSRKREELKKLLGVQRSPTQGLIRSTVNEGPLSPLHHGLKVGYGAADRLAAIGGDVLTGGVVRKVLGGEPIATTMAPEMYEEGAILPKAALPSLVPEPHQGGVMFAPRGKVDPTALKTSLLSYRRKIRGADYQIKQLQNQLGEAGNPKDIYASIEALKDDKEQSQAVMNQLLRVQRVTLPRQQAEEEASERAESLSDEFASKF